MSSSIQRISTQRPHWQDVRLSLITHSFLRTICLFFPRPPSLCFSWMFVISFRALGGPLKPSLHRPRSWDIKPLLCPCLRIPITHPIQEEKSKTKREPKSNPDQSQNVTEQPTENDIRPRSNMILYIIEEGCNEDFYLIPAPPYFILPPSRLFVVNTAPKSGTSLCTNCQQSACQSCGRDNEAGTFPAGSASQSPPAAQNQQLLPAPPSRPTSRAPSQASRAPSEVSYRTSQSRSGTVLLSDEPLGPSDSASQLPDSHTPRRSASTSSRSEISHRSGASYRSDLTADNLRRAASASGSRRSERSRTERFVEEQPLALMPPPSPSLVSHSLSRRPESSRPGSSHHDEQRRLTWPDEPPPSRAPRGSARPSEYSRPGSPYGQRIREWRAEASDVSHTPLEAFRPRRFLQSSPLIPRLQITTPLKPLPH
jgi:hypothetical protein